MTSSSQDNIKFTVQINMMTTLNYLVLYWRPLIWSLLFGIFGCLTNYFVILPLNGIYLIIYILFISILTIGLSFKILHNFLQQQNRPINFHHYYRKDDNDNSYKTKFIPNTSCIRELSTDIDKYFIRKWFINISNDEIFNKECRTLIEEVLQKLITVQLSLDKQMIVYSILNLYLKHLKEFRRSLKRKEKYDGNINELYRYSHSCNDSKKAQHYFIHQLTLNLLNHFINWELSNSLPYRILVSIISKKVILNLLNILSSPEFLNYYLLISLCSEKQRQHLQLDKYKRIQLKNIKVDMNLIIDDSNDETTIGTDKKKEAKEFEDDVKKIDDVPATAMVVDNAKDLITKIETDDVKIYEPKSCKTWYDSYDLESVTLGQDILDMIDDSDKDIDVTDGIKEEISPVSPVKSLFDEVKHMTSIEGIKTTIKPISDVTLHNIKDFQESTVNNVVKPVSQATSTALHKIGGLHLQDEAAGVVEGLLDFGRTKIRKGLRLTGLQDDIIEEQQEQQQQQSSHKRNIVKMAHVQSQEKSDEMETTWINPLQELTNNGMDDRKIPSILTQSHDDGSPEPEYEETADLATSIAKLRSLLEQKSSESSMSTPAVSPMPQEDFSNRILNETDEVDGMMPSFYKFCAKTATGVIHNTLNTIKTALPGNVNDRYENNNERWLFIEASTTENDLFQRMVKLLNERKVFCTVDTAYEAIDSLLPLENENKIKKNIQFKDELDDFEVTLPVTKALFDILTELLADRKDTLITQEPVIKSVLLLFGNLIEDKFITTVDKLINYWCINAKIPEEYHIETLQLDFDIFIETIFNNLPDYLKYTIGEDVLKHLLKLSIASLQIRKMNQDVFMQIFEIISIKLMDGSKNLSPISA